MGEGSFRAGFRNMFPASNPLAGAAETPSGAAVSSTPNAIELPTLSPLPGRTTTDRSPTARAAPRQNFLRRLMKPPPTPSGAGSSTAPDLDAAESPPPVFGGKNMSAFLHSTNDIDETKRGHIFGKRFQDAMAFRLFFAEHLDPVEGGTPVSGKFDDPQNWTTQTFHALFAAAWLQQPTEKGMYTIDISHLSKEQIDAVTRACNDKSNGTGRISSHYGSGQQASSMSRKFRFLRGYRELMVQVVTLPGHDGKDRTVIALKAEGATTDWLDALDHLAGYASQRVRGVGLQRSPELNKLAAESPLVTQRAAENFPNVHKALLRKIGLDRKDKTVLARDMAKALFRSAGYATPAQVDMDRDSNETIGQALARYCDDLAKANPMIAFGHHPLLTPDVLGNLRAVADSLRRDGDNHFSRVHCEVITTPEMLDAVIDIVQKPSLQRRGTVMRSVSTPLPNMPVEP